MIVVPQHRSRGYSVSIRYTLHHAAFSDATFDWNEMTLLYYLDRWSRRGGEAPLRPLRPDPEAPVFVSGVSGMDTVAQNTTWQHVADGVVKLHVKEEDVKQHVHVGKEAVQHVVDDVEQQVRGQSVDQLSGGGGVLWWDTSLPLGLASIADCQQLYQLGQDLHPLYLGNILKCYDNQHAGTATLGDMVTMLLNLLCNSVLQVPKSACCH